jgi:coenzyme F420 biosynthesis associated uncharacterized protein
MIDWTLAGTVARAVAATAPAAESGFVDAELSAFADRSAALVAEYAQLKGAVPPAESVSRGDWAVTSLKSMRSILDPVATAAGRGLGPARFVAGALLAAEAGALSGYLATRVLGQYEFPVMDPAAPARLLIVGPNVATMAKAMDADPVSVLRWVTLHESTHALQFAGVPWLRGHLASKVELLLGALTMNPKRVMRLPDVGAIVDAVRRGDLLSLAVGPQRRAVMDELQSFMALIEGHAEHVMDAVGEEVLGDLAQLRSGMSRRRTERSGFLRLFEKLIGLEMKLRQYEQGKRFVDAVVAQAGIEGLNRAWAGPDALPTAAELDRPLDWLRRVAA